MESTNKDDRGNIASRAVLITGCSSGIGQATALHLARVGFTVFATVRKETDAEQLRQTGLANLIPLCPLDLTSLVQIWSLGEKIEEELRRRGCDGLYGLVHNAGGGRPAPVELMDLMTFSTELQGRLVGATALTQALLPLIRKASGRIIWITTPAILPTPYVSSIHACDFAVNCLARTLDIELKPWKIPTIMIRCGGIRTPAGMRTTGDVQNLLAECGDTGRRLYGDRLEQWSKEMAGFDERRTDPEAVAKLVGRALQDQKPRKRYSTGYLSGFAALLESFPQPLADEIIKMRF